MGAYYSFHSHIRYMHVHHPSSQDKTNGRHIDHCNFHDCLGNSLLFVSKDPPKQRIEDLVDKNNNSLMTYRINAYNLPTPPDGHHPEEEEQSANGIIIPINLICLVTHNLTEINASCN